MAEDPNQVKQHIDSTRQELGHNVQELENRVKTFTDWRGYVDRSPMTMVTLAFAGGVVASALMGKSHRHENSSPRVYQHDKASETLDTVKGAMIGWAATQFKSALSELLPGFRQQYEAAERQKSAQLVPASREPLNLPH